MASSPLFKKKKKETSFKFGRRVLKKTPKSSPKFMRHLFALYNNFKLFEDHSLWYISCKNC